LCYVFFSSRRRHTRFSRDWSSDVCSSDLPQTRGVLDRAREAAGARMSKDALRLVLENVIAYAAELEVDLAAKKQDHAAAVAGWGRARDRVAELEARLAEHDRPADEDPIAYALTEQADDVTPQVAKLRALLAGQATDGSDVFQ